MTSSEKDGDGLALEELLPVLAVKRCLAERLVEKAAPDALFRLIDAVRRRRRDLFRGYQESVKSLARPVVRKRVAVLLVRDPEFAGVFVKTLEPWRGLSDSLSALDESWLLHYWRELIRNSQEPLDTLAALAVDERKALQRRGRLALRLVREQPAEAEANREAPPENPAPAPRRKPPQQRAEEFRKECEGLLQVLGVYAGARAPIAAAEERPGPDRPPDAGLRVLNDKIDRLQKELDKSRKASQSERRRHEQELEEKQKRIRELRDVSRALQAKNAELAEALEAAARNAVEEEYRRLQELSGVPPELIEKAGAEAAGVEPLIERARKVLEQHRQLNRSYAACSILRRRIAALETLLEELAECGRESVIVLPTLHDTKEEIEAEIRRLQALLPRDHSTVVGGDVGIIEAMLRDVDTIPNDESGFKRIREWEHLLEQKPIRRLLDEKQIRNVRRALAERYERIEQVLQSRMLAAAVPNSGKAPAGERRTRALLQPGRELQQLRESGRNPVILVDGYNVTKGVPELAGIETSEGLAATRTRLIDLCRGALPDCPIEIVFDGNDALGTVEQAGKNVCVRFAGRRQASHNADDGIVRRLQELSESEERAGTPLWLVTADQGLRRRSAGLCDRWMDPGDFYRLLTGE